MSLANELEGLIRTIPDYPKPGIMFRDVTTLLQNPTGIRKAVDGLAEAFSDIDYDLVAGIEARGFILGGALAYAQNRGFVTIRKKGKLPHVTLSQQYALEYGVDHVEIHADAVKPGQRVLLIDDLIATGGTAEAGMQLIRRLGGSVVGAGFVIDLPELGGARRLEGLGARVECLMRFGGH
ncbi:adenine phosphoribosyltransferase [Terrihabitans rhizophilus]|uniref:Adenine phosphoribosyltransferase n=1 Tax=Terrihabitans rhizophilus TaxID=3092662 RepID=A0ABU4RNH5_9HYPH|nr:adenine phosphoribosyltransferase [Terrihabitans sp. PJ23]MDX6806378.1 adenine phosphoribosyltransferase [Terrihabitans sp. PJ23]